MRLLISVKLRKTITLDLFILSFWCIGSFIQWFSHHINIGSAQIYYYQSNSQKIWQFKYMKVGSTSGSTWGSRQGTMLVGSSESGNVRSKTSVRWSSQLWRDLGYFFQITLMSLCSRCPSWKRATWDMTDSLNRQFVSSILLINQCNVFMATIHLLKAHWLSYLTLPTTMSTIVLVLNQIYSYSKQNIQFPNKLYAC